MCYDEVMVKKYELAHNELPMIPSFMILGSKQLNGQMATWILFV